MISTEAKVEVRTRGPLAPFMTARGVSVRDLVAKTTDAKRRWSRGTIGNLRAAQRPATVDPVLAQRIAKALDFPFDTLFVVRASTVQREAGPHGEHETTSRRRRAA